MLKNPLEALAFSGFLHFDREGSIGGRARWQCGLPARFDASLASVLALPGRI